METKAKIEQIKDAMNNLVFQGWTEDRLEVLENLLKSCEPRNDVSNDTIAVNVETIEEDLGDISNEFGEDQKGDWNRASERASHKISHLLRKVNLNFKMIKSN